MTTVATNEPLRFVHAADMHLQSPFVGLRSQLPDPIARALLEAPFGAWDDIVSLAIEQSVDAVLIAGDAYDDPERSLRAQHRFVDGLQRLHQAGIASHVICGNHDPLDGWDAGLRFPDSCRRYGPELEAAPLVPSQPERATVYGASFQSAACPRNLAREVPQVDPGQIAIALLHCAVGDDPGEAQYAPCSLADLRNRGIAYWALGHVHRPQVLLERDPVAVYAGCSQALRWSQTGPRGVFLVEVDRSRRVRPEFVATDRVRMEILEIDISAIESQAGLLEEFLSRLRAAATATGGRPLLCRIRLNGRGSLHEYLQSREAATDLAEELNSRVATEPFVWCDRIDIDTNPPLDRARRRAGGDLVADLLNVCDQLAQSQIDLPELEAALDELYGNVAYRPFLSGAGPSKDIRAELIAAAETRALDLLDS